jgi:predicted transcriptional regulator
MRDKIRLHIRVSPELAVKMEHLREERGITNVDMIREAMAIMLEVHEAQKDGLHVGFTRNRKKLETVLVLP